MENRVQQYFINIAKLPEEVQYYFESKIMGDIIHKVSNVYNIDIDLVIDLTIDFIVNDYSFIKLEKKVKESVERNIAFEEKNGKFIIDFLGAIFLPVDQYLTQCSIKKEIMKRGGNLRKYLKYINLVEDAIEDWKLGILDGYMKKYDELIDPEEEKAALRLIFEGKIVDILSTGTEGSLRILNSGILFLLNTEADYGDELSNMCSASQEKISTALFELEGEKKRPTIENWIKHFISIQGSGIFSNIDLSKYITSQENVKRLNASEKRLVKKLLRLYRNLTFFPDSLKDLPPNRWEIFPLDRQGSGFENIRKRPLGVPKSIDEKELVKLEEMEKGYKPDSLEKLALDEEIEKRKKIEELRYRLSRYKEGSLERKVLEEEILKLES